MPATVLHFDPASLALWFGLPSSGHRDFDEVIGTACNAAVSGDVDLLNELYSTLVGTARRDHRFEERLLGSVSSVWHESRPFVDLALSNYGAFKTRRYATIYANLATMFRELAGEDGHLHCPIVDYLDPVQRALFSLRSPSAPVPGPLTRHHHRSEALRPPPGPVPSPAPPQDPTPGSGTSCGQGLSSRDR